jgi:hypothetical protein
MEYIKFIEKIPEVQNKRDYYISEIEKVTE